MLFCVRGSTNKSKNSKNTYFSFILHKPAENLLTVLMTLTIACVSTLVTLHFQSTLLFLTDELFLFIFQYPFRALWHFYCM